MTKRKFSWEGFFVGAIAGLVGAVMASEYGWSLFSVGVAGAVVGLIVMLISRSFKK